MAQQNKFADVPLRVKTWIYIILTFTIALLHPILLLWFVVFLSFWGQKELYSFAMPKLKNSLFLLIGVTVIQLLYFPSKPFAESSLYLIGYFILVGVFILIQQKKYTLFFATIVAYVLSISTLYYIGRMDNGYKLLILLIVPVELNDVFQYLSGKLFGKRKIAPSISPNKTVEGLLGGVICTTIVFTTLYYLLAGSFYLWQVILLGATLSVLGFLGDVFFSFIKRKANVKDTGTLLPGHGGLLDRVDSLLFTAPLFYFII